MKPNVIVVAGLFLAIGSLSWGCGRQGSAGPQTVKIAVTDAGFEPAEVRVRGGEPVTFLVTRTTDATCAKEIVIADAGIRQELPLDREIRITFTPEKRGTMRYACGMDMIAGSVRVQ